MSSLPSGTASSRTRARCSVCAAPLPRSALSLLSCLSSVPPVQEDFPGPSLEKTSRLHTLSLSLLYLFIFSPQPSRNQPRGLGLQCVCCYIPSARTVPTENSEENKTYTKGDSGDLQKSGLQRVAKRSNCHINFSGPQGVPVVRRVLAAGGNIHTTAWFAKCPRVLLTKNISAHFSFPRCLEFHGVVPRNHNRSDWTKASGYLRGPTNNQDFVDLVMQSGPTGTWRKVQSLSLQGLGQSVTVSHP